MREIWKNHSPTAAQREQVEAARKLYRAVNECLQKWPNCRHRALALTALEESFMWAERVAVLYDPNEPQGE